MKSDNIAKPVVDTFLDKGVRAGRNVIFDNAKMLKRTKGMPNGFMPKVGSTPILNANASSNITTAKALGKAYGKEAVKQETKNATNAAITNKINDPIIKHYQTKGYTKNMDGVTIHQDRQDTVNSKIAEHLLKKTDSAYFDLKYGQVTSIFSSSFSGGQ